MKTKLVMALLITILFCSSAVLNSPVNSQEPEPETTRLVFSPEQATELALAWTVRKQGTLPTWQGASVSPPTIYYDLDGRPAVYVFSVLAADEDVSNEDVGHIIVSCPVVDSPILAFGRGVAPHLRCPACVDAQALAKQNLKLADKNPVYLGPVDSFYHVLPLDADAQTDSQWEHSFRLIPMGDDRPIVVNHAPAPAYIDVPSPSTPDLSTPDVSGAATSKHIFGVPDYNQFVGSDYGYGYSCYSGCTPTAATSMVHFWDRAGHSGLAYSNWRDTTLYMRTYMKTFCYGSSGATYTNDTSPGMIQYAQTRGYNFQSSQYCWPGTNWMGCIGDASWSLYTSQIDLSYPVLISLDTAYYGGHSVVGMGYDNDGGQFWIIHDNWPSTPEDVWVNSASSSDRFYHTFIPPVRDSTPPTAAMHAPRYHLSGPPIPISWSGHDNASGVARYDLQYRKDGGEWQTLYSSTTYTHTTVAGQLGSTYTFRSRSYDLMGNVSPWAEASSTVYQYQVSGRVTGNQGHATLNTQVTASPGALNVAAPDIDGNWSLYFSAAQSVSLNASAGGYGPTGPMKGISTGSNPTGMHLVLPPANDVIVNGGFESGLSSWQTGGAIVPTIATGSGHTGDAALALGMSGSVTSTVWQVTQTFTAVITDQPTLSFFYMLNGAASAGDKLWVRVENEGGTTALWSWPLTVTAWTHAWVSAEPLAGQPITVSLGVENTDLLTTGAVLIDEISLGDGSLKLDNIFLPGVFKNW